MYNVYQLGDGVWIALGMVIHSDKFWPRLCDAVDATELIGDERFRSADLRDQNHHALIEILDEQFSKLTWDEWERRSKREEMITCRVNSLTDLTADEQILANEYMTKRSHRDLGEFWYVNTPIKFEKTPVQIRSEAPHHGEHNEEILRELGMSDAQIGDLRERKVI
jgi:CoA:oxalate CoA-transferase